MLQIGESIPDFSLPGADGKVYRSSDFAGKKPSFIFILRIIHPAVRNRRVLFRTFLKIFR